MQKIWTKSQTAPVPEKLPSEVLWEKTSFSWQNVLTEWQEHNFVEEEKNISKLWNKTLLVNLLTIQTILLGDKHIHRSKKRREMATQAPKMQNSTCGSAGLSFTTLPRDEEYFVTADLTRWKRYILSYPSKLLHALASFHCQILSRVNFVTWMAMLCYFLKSAKFVQMCHCVDRSEQSYWLHSLLVLQIQFGQRSVTASMVAEKDTRN